MDDYVKTLIDQLKVIINPFSASVDRMKHAAANWYKQYKKLQQIPDSSLSPELVEEKRELLERGDSIIDKISSLGLSVDTLQSQLGALPLVAIGVIVTAAGLMLYWTYDFVQFNKRMKLYREFRADGLNHDEATTAVNEIAAPRGFFDNLGTITKYGAIGGGLLLTYYLAKKNRWL